jgi:hypothetical protein
MNVFKNDARISYGFGLNLLDLPIEQTGFWPIDAVSWERTISTDSIPGVTITRANGSHLFGHLQYNASKTALVFTPQSGFRREVKK